MKPMTDTEKLLIELLNDELYTVQFVEEWTQRPPANVFINAPAALQQISVDGFYRAVCRMAENFSIGFRFVEGLEHRHVFIMVNDPARQEEVCKNGTSEKTE